MPLQIDIFGNIQNWPKNFFGDEMGDIAEQGKAVMYKKESVEIIPGTENGLPSEKMYS